MLEDDYITKKPKANESTTADNMLMIITDSRAKRGYCKVVVEPEARQLLFDRAERGRW